MGLSRHCSKVKAKAPKYWGCGFLFLCEGGWRGDFDCSQRGTRGVLSVANSCKGLHPNPLCSCLQSDLCQGLHPDTPVFLSVVRTVHVCHSSIYAFKGVLSAEVFCLCFSALLTA